VRMDALESAAAAAVGEATALADVMLVLFGKAAASLVASAGIQLELAVEVELSAKERISVGRESPGVIMAVSDDNLRCCVVLHASVER